LSCTNPPEIGQGGLTIREDCFFSSPAYRNVLIRSPFGANC
jgi:hypothetical protein